MRRLKGALIGFGFIAEKGHLPAYAAGGLEIIAVADINVGADGAQLQSRFPTPASTRRMRRSLLAKPSSSSSTLRRHRMRMRKSRSPRSIAV